MNDPLVSIIIPTYNRTGALMKRSLPSAMNQDYENLEILVVGDGTEQDTVDAMSQIDDPRIKFTNLPHYSNYPTDGLAYWAVGGVPPLNWALDQAQGEWITYLGDDDALMKHHVSALLEGAIEQDVDYIYGKSVVLGVGNTDKDEVIYGVLGRWPPEQAGMGMGLWKAEIKGQPSLGYRFDIDSWKNARPCDWDFVYRMLNDGVRFGYIPRVTYKYYPNKGIPNVTPGYVEP